MAMRLMQEFHPDLAEIPDPDAYFAEVGEKVLAEINIAMASWDHRHPDQRVDEDRRNMARLEAEDVALKSEPARTPPTSSRPV